ncbi:HD family hydrolase [Dickeya fangzhongdai]|uniref:HD family hydrolase n=1 Tax=Dickeya fangzhongdai TaxID=1778540 RepID=UPI001ADD11B9|nr:HD family hydrolase [Dickeya fangzhongdai]MBO8135535.1 HD family hydrolase [Dickeya fangzhongdai]
MSYIITFTGKKFSFTNPCIDDICIEDIAHALSLENRFGGHTAWPYSVAQHCIGASYIAPAGFEFEALMHDAAEAYCKDIPSPLKAILPDYKTVEMTVETLIRLRFGLPVMMSREVKHTDLVMLASEKIALQIQDNEPWEILHGIEPAPYAIVPMDHVEVEREFLRRFYELSGAGS